jgi:hypothetical protein
MKLSPLSFIGAFLFLTMVMSGCQKEELANPQISYRAPGGPPPCTNANPTWSNNAPCAGDDLIVTFCVSATCGLQQMQYEVTPGVWVVVAQEQPTDGCVSYTIPAAAAGAYNFKGHYVGNAGGCNQNVCDVGFNDFTYTVNVVACGCPYEGNSFTGTSTTTCGSNVHSATYTLCSEDGIASFHMQGGLTNFTGADATVAWVGGSGVVVSQHTPGNSSNRIVEVDGSLAECSCITVTMSWNSTNTNGEVTGQWSASSAAGTLIAAPLVCNNP